MNIQAPTPDNVQQDGLDGLPRKHKVLLAVVIILGVLLIAGFVLVIATIVIRVSQSDGDGTGKRAAAASAAVIESPVPDGAKVMSMVLSSGQLAVQVQPKSGPVEILVYDVKKRLLLSHIRLGKAAAQ